MADSLYGDTLRLFVYGKFISASRTLPTTEGEKIAVINKNGIATFNLPEIKTATYFTLSKEKLRDTAHYLKRVPILYQYFIEPGDNVTVNVLWDSTYDAKIHTINIAGNKKVPEIEYFDNMKYRKQYKFLFGGNGATKYQVRADLDKLKVDSFQPSGQLWDENGSLMPSPKILKGLEMINFFKTKISPLAYQILQADLIGEDEQARLKGAWNATPAKRMEALKVAINTFPSDVLVLSRHYTGFLEFYYKFKYRIDPNVAGEGAYFHIKNDYSDSELRDKLLTLYLLDLNYALKPEIITDAIKTIKTPFYLNEIMGLYKSFTKGQYAFDFSLPDDKGNIIHLSDLKGKVVFIDFWYTGCGGCLGYYQSIVSKAEERLKGNPDVIFISVSIDTDWKKWLKSVNEGRYTSAHIPNVINLYTDGKGTKHPVIENYKISSYPRPLLIDKEGKIFSSKETEIRSDVNGVEKLVDTILSAIAQH